MKQQFPEDIDYAISLDHTASVTEGMKEGKNLLDAQGMC
jgi:hypothetical protein